jgi:anaerobic magnesium-protoporphyrin IX monomethyl ester cyclase
VVLTDTRLPIPVLDNWRVGWELIERWDDYRCFGLGRAAIVQFSRGCPHRCTYCGQHGFWVKWRHRDPVKLADEIEWLHRTHGVNFVTLADENPTTLKDQWRSFLEEMVARNVPVHLFATIRASDIVRDRDMLNLYREARILYILMGIESTSDEVLKQIKKGSTAREDYEACRLLKEHGIFSIVGHIVGFEEETWSTFRTALRQLRLYGGDYLNAMYVTPHAWTTFGDEVRGRGVIQPDQAKWDYRHQILAQKHLRPWQLFLAVKSLELRFHLTPRRLGSMLRGGDRLRRHQRRWVFRHIGLVWLAEVVEFVLGTSFARESVTLAELEKANLVPVQSRSALASETRANSLQDQPRLSPADGADDRRLGDGAGSSPRRLRS